MEPWVKIRERVRTKEALVATAAKAATGFESLGIGKGDVIAVYLRNDFPILEATVGAGMVGAYTVPVNWHNSPDEAAYIFENSGAKAVVIHADLLRKIAPVVPPQAKLLVVDTPQDIIDAYGLRAEDGVAPPDVVRWEDWVAGFAPKTENFQTPPGSMIYTSGTTGRPKGVRREPSTPEQQASSMAMARIIGGLNGWLDKPHAVKALIPGPAYHSSPNGWIFNFFNFGANLLLEPRFDAELLLQTIEREKVTHILAVPTMFVRLLALPEAVRNKYDLSSIVHVMHVGSPCPVHVKRAMIAWWGPVITEHYGSTEVGAVTYCDSHEWLARPGTVGKVMEGTKLLILDEDGNVLDRNATGEVATRRDVYADFTYHHDDDKRRKSDKHGLVATGDVGYLDDEGYLYLCGRSSDMIISGGTNIYPAEIEAELLKVPGVADCAVFGIPDEEFGEQICAYIQAEPGAVLDAATVKTELRQHLAGYKIPKRIEFSDALPREDSGKIFKRKLRQPYWDALGRQI